MPSYEFRCNTCGRPVTLFYKRVADYEAAQHGEQTCPHCGGIGLTRQIRRVAFAKPTKDYTRMSSGEMLSVFENGDSREVGRMIHEVGGDAALNDAVMSDAARRLMNGDNPAKVEHDLSAASSSDPPPLS